MQTLEPIPELTPVQSAGVGLFLLLLVASLIVWGGVLRRLVLGRPACPPGPPERRTWSRGFSFVAVAIVIPLQLLMLANVAGDLVPHSWKQNSEETSLSSVPLEEKLVNLETVRLACALNLMQVVILVGLPAVFSPFRWTDVGAVASREDLTWGALGFLASWLPVSVVNGLVSLSGWRGPEGKHVFFQLLEQDPSLQTLLWIGLAVVVAAPIAEELVYRAVLQGFLEQHLPAWGAVGISSLIFAAVHYSPGRPDAIPLLPLAVLLGLVYSRRRSLPAVILLHALFNGTMLVLALMLGNL